MNLETLKAEHPAIYKAAVGVGIQQERDRVTAHLQAGRKVGDLPLALRSVRNGAELTPTIMAHYLAAGRNRADLAAWQADCAEAEGAILNAKRPASAHRDSEADPADAVIKRLQALLNTGDSRIEDLEANE